MAPTRRKPTKRKNREESIGAAAGALSVDELREESTAFPAEAFHSAVAYDEPSDDGGYGHAFAGEGQDATLEPEDHAEGARQPRRLSAIHIVLIVVLVVLIAIEGGFCLLRWAPNDAADMQGTWYVNESTKTISITDEVIVLAEDVAYEYDIDKAAKTIEYRFGIMEGSGRYRFSLDRSQLAIMDGEFTFGETLMSDISWTFEALLAQIFGDPLAPGTGEAVALLTRAPFEESAPLPDDPASEGDAPVGDAPADEGGSGEDSASSNEGESQEGTSSDSGEKPQAGEAPEKGEGSSQEGSSKGDKLTVVDKLVVSDKPMSA